MLFQIPASVQRGLVKVCSIDTWIDLKELEEKLLPRKVLDRRLLCSKMF
jgi:hypothetical protein